MRFDLTRALTRRILNGDIKIDREDDRYYVAYDKIMVERVENRLVISLSAKNVVIADMEIDMINFVGGQALSIVDLEGRMEVRSELTMPTNYANLPRSNKF